MARAAPTDEAILAWVRLIRAERSLLGAVAADLKAAGLSALEWYDVLLELKRARKAGLRPLELERRLLLPQHNLSRLIGRLAKAGYVERVPCPRDGRGQMVKITPEGARAQRATWVVYAASIQRHLGSKLSNAECKKLAHLLQRLE